MVTEKQRFIKVFRTKLLGKRKELKFRLRRKIWLGLLFLGFALNFGIASPANAAISSNLTDVTGGCSDLYIIFARGSGEALSGPSEQAWREEMTKILRPRTISYEFYELGSQRWGGFQYPAVAVSDSLDGYAHMVGAAVSAGESYEFGRSVVAGSGELAGYMSEKIRTCPNAKFILGGYSQGAMVISAIVNRLPADKILYVATFGDPKLYLPEGKFSAIKAAFGRLPDACYGQNLSNYRIHVPDCMAYEGILGSYQPYQTEPYIDKIGTWCNKNDIMCSSGSSLENHTGYVGDGLYKMAAQKISRVIKKAYPDQVHASGREDYSNAQVLIMLDRMTESQERFDAYKEQAKILAGKVLSSGGEVAILFYGEGLDGYAANYLEFEGAEENSIIYYIDKSEPIFRSPENTRDRPGHAMIYIMDWAIRGLKWRDGATKSMMIFTDTKCLSPSWHGVTTEDLIELSLSIDPVNVYVSSDQDVIESYGDLITGTSGASFAFGTDISLTEEIILDRPEASLKMLSYIGLVDEEFYFDASDSVDAYGESQGLRYDWDLDFDGKFELLDAGPTVATRYHDAQTGYIQVRVTDSAGKASTMSASVEVTTELISLPEVLSLESKPLSPSSAQITFTTTGAKNLLILNDAPIGFLPQSGSFVVNQLTSAATVRIVPYNETGQRGLAATTIALPFLPGVPNSGRKAGVLGSSFGQEETFLRVQFLKK